MAVPQGGEEGVPGRQSPGRCGPQAAEHFGVPMSQLVQRAAVAASVFALTITAGASAAASDPTVISHALAAPGSTLTFRPELRGLPDYDLSLLQAAGQPQAAPAEMPGRLQAVLFDRSLGLPTFLWAREDAAVADVGPLQPRELLIAAARAHLAQEAAALKLTPGAIADAAVADVDSTDDGVSIVRFRQVVDGVEVYHRSLNVLLGADLKPVAVSGYFANGYDPEALPLFAGTGAAAVATAWTSLGGALSVDALTADGTRGGWQMFQRPLVEGTHWFERGPRARPVWYAMGGSLVPAWQVEIFAKAKRTGNLMAYSLVVGGLDGKILSRTNLKADAAYTYRVFADTAGPLHQPFDSPLGNAYAPFPNANVRTRLARVSAQSALVTLENAGIKTNDPWLADDATETTGNHVDACIDAIDQGVDTPIGSLAVPPPVNSCLPDVEPRAAPTSTHTFDYPITADEDPATDSAMNAAIVNLFYINNWLHDWWYNRGFNEEAGNAQTSNFGRGGEEGDPVLAQGQDASGRNNANMATPADGSSPVMQQYLFDGTLAGEVRQIAPVAGQPLTWEAVADAGAPTYNFDGVLALASDGSGDVDSDGCGPTIPYPAEVVAASPVGAPYKATPAPPQMSLSGKIALVDRGQCNTTFKIQFAIESGAIGLIVVNNVDGDPPSNIGNLDLPLAPAQPTEYAYMTMPTVIIRKDDGAALKAAMAAGDVTVHMERTASKDVDGTLDNQIVSHEYFHYVHHRLTDSSNQQSSAMSEGWGDIDAFMLTVRPDDLAVKLNAGWTGAYGLANYVTNNAFRGIRRAPYSTTFAYNAFTLKHIADGNPTPDGGTGAGNSEVHAAGEIWANEMFECYVGVLTNPKNSFETARTRMQDYIIRGLKLTPADATYTEARDAVLAVVRATDKATGSGDFARCSHGFARRGNGAKAVAPDRASTDLTGVVEDFTEFAPVKSGAASSTGLLVGALNPALLLGLFGLGALRSRRRR